ncbi:MAG: hypothetical protein KGD58_10880 [Candidatus Lokiarchaeota archaeon]|nr:hypothetical protein [Candidatus Lokiarchaeota archaeon]
MRRNKIYIFTILTVFFVSIIGGASAYHEYIYTFDYSHTAGCHNGNANDGESSTGNLTITLTPSGTLETLQAFTISVFIHNFTELDNSAYQNRTTIGISKDLGNNSAFLRDVSDVSFSRRVKVDQYGSDLTPTVLGAIAPETPGTYELVITAVAAMNQSDASAYNFTFAKGTISVTVVASTGGGGTISGGLLTIIIGSTFAVSTVLIVTMRKRINKREL